MTPESQLRLWSASVESVENLVSSDGPLDEVAGAVARSVIVAPNQRVAAAHRVLATLRDPETPKARLAMLDLMNALSCAGMPISAEDENRMQAWLPELLDVGPPLALRLRVGLAALAFRNSELAARIAEPSREPFVGCATFPNDLLSLLSYLVAATKVRATLAAVEPAWNCAVDECAALCDDGQLDEPTLLWLARVIFVRFGGRAVGEVATLVHDRLRTTRAAADEPPPEPPVGSTLDQGAFRVERILRGRDVPALCIGRDVTRDAAVLVSLDFHSPRRQNVEELRSAISHDVPGILELLYVGTVDDNAGQWGVVERLPRGTWLPWILGAADPWTAPRKAIELGLSAGRILQRAAECGVVLAEIRPELMWAERVDGRYEVTGLSTRAAALFARKSTEMGARPVFDRYYRAPEAARDPDDRAISYSLAVMIAEWASGRYPFASLHAAHGVETAAHEPLAVPEPLGQLLRSTLRRERTERPTLPQFIRELEALAETFA